MPLIVLALGLLGASPEETAADHNEARAGVHVAMAESPLVVTSDSMQYCHDLDSRVMKALATYKPASASTPDVRELEAQGVALCQAGHLLPGIARLRNALSIVKH
ncbi:hypothetical protein [Acidomonas methanolica]|nr:hypothetical protein [Acidomonas methanolica]MBU2652852.1 hypothetical protein [Acidomonas methanolica]